MKQKLEKWQRDIARIRPTVIGLVDHRRWNRVYEAIVAANPHLRPAIPVLDCFSNVYADCAVMAIYREVRTDDNSVSLFGLLEDLAENFSFITRAWTRQLYETPLASGDRVVAHVDRRGSLGAATFDDLNVAIDMIEELTKRYLLLTGESLTQMAPIDVTNSIGVFPFPWIDPDHPPQLGNETL